jgi:anti-sigma regulatory factor (Ser/Thr protein kinase)
LAVSDQAAGGGGIRHVAWLYRTPGEYLASIRDFAAAGASAGEPVLVAVPSGRLPTSWNLPGAEAGARTVDAAGLGRNPARLVPAVRAFADEHRGQAIRVISELAWAGRSGAELGEIARYEMMVNLAFAATNVTMLCPYDAAVLPRSAIAAARASHPWLREDGQERTSGDFRWAPVGQDRQPSALPVPPGARALSYRSDLRPVRAFVADEADRAGLSGSRRTDLVIAASEVAANTLKHTGGPGLVRVWVTSDEILCQFDDSGYISEPLAGYGRPAADEPGGPGLWLVNQVCDLAEIRSSAAGTTIRLHLFRDVPAATLPDGDRVREPRLGLPGWPSS